MNIPTHLSGPVAGLVALFTAAVGCVVAFVPSVSALQEGLIASGTVIISSTYMIANSIHHRAAAITAAAAPTLMPGVVRSSVASDAKAEVLRGQLRSAGLEPRA